MLAREAGSADSTYFSSAQRIDRWLRKSLLFVVALTIIAMAGCDSTSMEDEPATIEVRPSDQLRELASENPEDFTWDIFAEEIVVELDGDVSAINPDSDSLSLWLRTVQAVGSESGKPDIVGTRKTEPITVSTSQLTEGIRTADLLAATNARPLKYDETLPTSEFSPVSDIRPWQFAGPVNSQKDPGPLPPYIANQVLGDRDLGPEEAIVAVYGEIPTDTMTGTMLTPMGLLFDWHGCNYTSNDGHSGSPKC